MVKMPIFTVSFERVAIDIVDPLSPRSSEHRYSLTLAGYESSFPEVVPLKIMTTMS